MKKTGFYSSHLLQRSTSITVRIRLVVPEEVVSCVSLYSGGTSTPCRRAFVWCILAVSIHPQQPHMCVCLVLALKSL